MEQISETRERLLALGRRLRAARLERDEPMAHFAQRLGVSERTLRAMERGVPTVHIGAWLHALWVLDRLQEIDRLLESTASLLERARAERLCMPRQRASRRPR